MRKCVVFYGTLAVFLFTAVNCAKRGSPTGGDKDTTPPEIVKADPPNNSVNFDKKRIRIYFNEYVVLKDVQKQLIISPPLKQHPEITPQGSASKFIDIKISDTLAPNTTYVFNFGQSITDNNEGNPYHFFSYVFSTGSYIDSLSVSGTVKDALKRNTDDFVSVMLYRVDSTFTDSVIYKKPPTYITSTLDSATTFTLTNLRAGTYMLAAMKDMDNNYVFNRKTDKIAFKKEFIEVPTDSVYELKLFGETPDYRAAKPVQASGNRIIFGYEGAADSISIALLSPAPEDFKYRIVKDREKDSLYYWFSDIKADSLLFGVAHKKQVDTFSVKMKAPAKDTLTLEAASRGNLSLKDPFVINANIPLVSVNGSNMKLINKDSAAVAFTAILDSVKNHCRIVWNVQPNERYKLELLPGAITDFFGHVNDTLRYSLTTKSLADYGNVRITLRNAEDFPVLVQLVTETDAVADEIYAPEPREVFDFRNLDPAKYYIRVIFDTNKNGKWDPGNYLQKKQPERVSYYPAAIDVRANWELEQVFSLK
ncbi:MAG: Ig-like domain-containing protein [Sinomicrobium sp.]|nr:Ig-like domain-containing protein [Sinomicrobium sp.]